MPTLMTSDCNMVAFIRTSSDKEALVFVNTRNNLKTFDLPENIQNTNWTDVENGKPVSMNSTQNLDAFEYVVFVKDED